MLSKLPHGIYNFVIRYLNNTLPNATNTFKWKISASKLCNFCHNDQTLGHVVGGCRTFLDEKRYNWRHDSIILSLASMIPRHTDTAVYADVPGFSSPSVITGDAHRPDIVIKINNSLWVLELTVGFETNILKNFDRKQTNYTFLLSELRKRYSKVTYANLSMGACGVVGKNSNLLKLMKELKVPDSDSTYHVTKIINICSRSTYYIFSCRNKDWSNPELMSW